MRPTLQVSTLRPDWLPLAVFYSAAGFRTRASRSPFAHRVVCRSCASLSRNERRRNGRLKGKEARGRRRGIKARVKAAAGTDRRGQQKGGEGVAALEKHN